VTPAERVVLEVAVRWRRDLASPASEDDLAAAVDVLNAERATPHTEHQLTYGELVAGDQIQSTHGRWFEVDRIAVDQDQTGVHVWLVGVAKPFDKFRGQSVTVRRSALGEAVDMFASVLWSGPDSKQEKGAA
jgi:hypothetical protein